MPQSNSQIETPKFFGRRQGRTIRKAKSFLLETFLPRVVMKKQKISDLSACFSEKKQSYCLEIGFGDGEHLAAVSAANPQKGYIGIEVYKNGVANLLSLITGLKQGALEDLRQEAHLIKNRSDNVRIFDDDARLLFSYLPDHSFDKVYLLFPDPWPKNRHAERRFVNPQNLKELARLIKKGGILQIATDHPIYKKWVLEQMRINPDFRWTAKTSDDWRYPPADWHETKYQKKALREGRRPVFFEFERI